MVKMILIILMLISLTSSSWVSELELSNQPIPWPFTLCASCDIWQMKNVSFSDQPKRGKQVTIKALGIVNIAISFHSVHFQTYHNNKFLHEQQISFNHDYDQGDTLKFDFSYYIPEIAQSGKYIYSFAFMNQQNKQDGCFLLQFNI